MISGELYRNRDGVTQTRRIPEAATINGITILINEATELPARNAAGHEAYHFWKNDSERTVYEEAVKDNLLFTSDQYMWYQNEIAQTYFNDSIDLADDMQMKKFFEELIAYISGDIHEGTHEDRLRPMLRDYDAVKAAWQALVEKRTEAVAVPKEAAFTPAQARMFANGFVVRTGGGTYLLDNIGRFAVSISEERAKMAEKESKDGGLGAKARDSSPIIDRVIAGIQNGEAATEPMRARTESRANVYVFTRKDGTQVIFAKNAVDVLDGGKMYLIDGAYKNGATVLAVTDEAGAVSGFAAPIKTNATISENKMAPSRLKSFSGEASRTQEQSRSYLSAEADKEYDSGEAALLAYKSGGSYTLNAKLREGMALSEQEQAIVDGLDRFLEKLPVHKGRVYRNVMFDGFGDAEARDAFVAGYPVGEIVRHESYTSTSTSTEGYPLEGKYVVHMVIEGVNGRDVEGYGNNFEKEILFARESNFITDRIEYAADGTPTIYVTEVSYEREGVQEAPARNPGRKQRPPAKTEEVSLRTLQEQGTEGVEMPPAPGGDPEGHRDRKNCLPGVRGNGTEVTDGSVQEQQRRETLTDREVLSMAADRLLAADLSDGEQEAIRIFRSRLSKLQQLQEQRIEQGTLYRQQQFTAPADRKGAQATRNRMDVLDGQIKAAEEQVQAIVDGLDRFLEKLPVHKGKVYRNVMFDGF